MKHSAVYHLKDRHATCPTPVNAFFHFNGQQLKLATGITIEPKKWDAKRQRPKRGYQLEFEVNRLLDAMAIRLAAIVMDLEHSGVVPTPAIVADRFRAPNAKPSIPVELFACYDSFIEQSANRLQWRTIERHKTAIYHLRRFETATRTKVRFDRIDSTFFDRLASYLVTTADLTNVSAWNVIKPFRAFARWAHESGITANDEYRRYTQRRLPKGDQSRKEYLTTDELAAILALDLTDDARLAKVRDVLVFQSETGIRYGDLLTLKPEHVADDTLRLVTGKNRKRVEIPMSPEASAIWAKYDGQLPRISNQKQSSYIKELARKAGITKSIVVVTFKGAKRVDTVVEKCDLLATHSAKRTFVTIQRQRGVSPEALCHLTGNSRRTIETYLVDTTEDAKREMRKGWVSNSA